MTQASQHRHNLALSIITTHARTNTSAAQNACALMQESHLVVDVGQEALQLPGVLSLPSPWLLLVSKLGLLDAGNHIDLHVQHNH